MFTGQQSFRALYYPYATIGDYEILKKAATEVVFRDRFGDTSRAD